MELKFTIKIKDERNPPIFSKDLGKGVLEKIVVDFKTATEEDLKNNPMFHLKINDMIKDLIDNCIEVTYEKV